MIINRVGHDPFEVKRGDRVSYNGRNVTVKGVSEARKKIRIILDNSVRNNGFEVEFGFIYPPLMEVIPNIPKNQSNLSTAIYKVNKRNEPLGGWGEADKIAR